MKTNHKIYLLLGSNLNNPQKQLELATIAIKNKLGMVIRSSSRYTTAAWGNTNQPDFLNQVLVVETTLSPADTLEMLLKIEKEMGRERLKKYEARIIDIDILFYGKEIIQTPELIVPHPLIQERRFVLMPLNEVSPAFMHPILKKSIHQLLLKCKDKLTVKKIID